MSQSVPQQPLLTEAARGDAPSTPHADRPLPAFPQHAPAHADPHSPIEREIERSERASAALAAARALARASFTDSELAADNAAEADGDIDTSGWVRTEYAALDQSVRAPQEEVPHGGAPRNLVGGSFNPGIDAPQPRPFAAQPIAQSPMQTRTGAQARFMHEARHSRRAEPAGAPAASRLDLSTNSSHYDKPAVVPMLATPVAAPGTRAPAATAAVARPRRAAGPSDTLKVAVAVGVGALAVLAGGGAAWKAGWLSRSTPSNPAIVTAQVAAQAEAARVLSSAQQEIPVAPAAGTAPQRSDAEVDAALAAAARAAAVPVESVHAAGPARAVPATPAPVAAAVVKPAALVAPSTATPATKSANTAAAPHQPQPAKESVASAVARAQARADSFLATDTPAAGKEAPAASAETKPAQ